jgi:hypothetical protein
VIPPIPPESVHERVVHAPVYRNRVNVDTYLHNIPKCCESGCLIDFICDLQEKQCRDSSPGSVTLSDFLAMVAQTVR